MTKFLSFFPWTATQLTDINCCVVMLSKEKKEDKELCTHVCSCEAFWPRIRNLWCWARNTHVCARAGILWEHACMPKNCCASATRYTAQLLRIRGETLTTCSGSGGSRYAFRGCCSHTRSFSYSFFFSLAQNECSRNLARQKKERRNCVWPAFTRSFFLGPTLSKNKRNKKRNLRVGPIERNVSVNAGKGESKDLITVNRCFLYSFVRLTDQDFVASRDSPFFFFVSFPYGQHHICTRYCAGQGKVKEKGVAGSRLSHRQTVDAWRHAHFFVLFIRAQSWLNQWMRP